MAIRKTGMITGEVTGVEGQGIARTAALDAQWRPEDDEALAVENAAADQGDA